MNGKVYGTHRYTENGEWSLELRRRLWESAHSASTYEEGFAALENPYQITRGQSFHQLTEMEVILAIAAIWRGLAEYGHYFAFGDVAMFRNARLQKQAQAACVPRATKRFIMPLVFGSGIQNPPLDKNGADAEETTANYSVLAAAEYPLHGKESIPIRLIFWYSKPRPNGSQGASAAKLPVSEELIRETARSIVRNSRFTSGLRAKFDDQNEEWRPVPDAVVSGSFETSPYHLVLHAWAYMLDIPIEARHTREVETVDDVLYTQTRELINLALRGSLTLETIRLFLLEVGYALDGPGPRLNQKLSQTKNTAGLAARQEDEVRRCRAYLMNEVVFDKIISDLRSDKDLTHIRPIGVSKGGDPNLREELMEQFQGLTKQVQEIGKLEQLEPQIKAAAAEIARDVNERTDAFEERLDAKLDAVQRAVGSPTHSAEPQGLVQQFNAMNKKIDENANALKEEIRAKNVVIEATQPTESLSQRVAAANTWTQRFKISHEYFRRQWTEAGKRPFTGLDDWPGYDKVIDNDGVFSAIGSIWWALWQKGRRFSLPTQQACQWNRTAVGVAEGHRAIAGTGAQYPLLLPLVVDYDDFELPPRKTREEKQRKLALTGSILSHYIVLTAAPPKSQKFTGRLGDYIFVEPRGRRPNHQKLDPIAKDLINRVGWLSFDPETNHAIETDRPVMLLGVPEIQQLLFDNGALHAILTSWAYMLGFKRDRVKRLVADPDSEESERHFYTMGFEVIECVIAGMYDTQTIQAFFHAYGYIDHQDYHDKNRLVMQAPAVAMDPSILETLITGILEEEQAERLSKMERVIV